MSTSNFLADVDKPTMSVWDLMGLYGDGSGGIVVPAGGRVDGGVDISNVVLTRLVISPLARVGQLVSTA